MEVVNRAERRRLAREESRKAKHPQADPAGLADGQRAVHEAAHVAVALHFNREVVNVVLDSPDHAFLDAYTERRLEGVEPDPATGRFVLKDDPGACRQAEEEIIISLAGRVADEQIEIAGHKKSRGTITEHATTDENQVRHVLYALGARNAREAARMVEPLYAETQALVECLYAGIRAIALGLFERRKLSGAEARELMEEAGGKGRGGRDWTTVGEVE